MARFSEIFQLEKTQGELDFVDIDLAFDNPLYLCPYAIQIRNDEWSELCGDHIRSFFNEVLDKLRDGAMPAAERLLGHLHEPNETFLGQSTGQPSGRGVGQDKASALADALVRSRAFATGILGDVSEAELFIPGIGKDTISDLVTNVLRGVLTDYTLSECQLHGIAVQATRSLGPAWNMVTRNWESRAFELPHYRNKPIILVPRFSVRRQLTINSQEFYNHAMVEYLQAEYLQAGAALVETLKNGRKRVTKKSVKERHPFIKDDLATFVRAHPEILDRYKELKGASGPMDAEDLEQDFDERALAAALKERLQQIPGGSENASGYHKLMIGICTFIFSPNLINPIKEFEQHNGRKRIDIKFTNTATDGFFHRILEAPQTRALSVFVECKNYTKRVANPELDQLSGRFGHQRGFFGMLLCREMDNRQRVIDGCRDAANDGRGFMLVFEDRDFLNLLDLIIDGDRRAIERYLNQRFDEISN